ncbi:hypothetical protein DL771_012016 [Monosporascus sp. 5C6A]|nr:hypothetical protein DL771_012016 [Monosporascus sp. 5C6A]
MRLLNTDSLSLETFPGSPPSYAILSHTWDNDEVLFQHAEKGRDAWKSKAGASKIVSSAKVAKDRGHGYIWIDTCCIDKTSSAELSEAINSMFKWYEGASVCLAFLSDLDDRKDLASCRWFTRGWTLQELLAPRQVEFYNSKWQHVGSRTELSTEISDITLIEPRALRYAIGKYLGSFAVCERMRWAAERRTTREEDMVYCLLGLFQVNMPLLYGEGESKAFRRLQEEILRESNDQSILFHAKKQHLLAGTLADFRMRLKISAKSASFRHGPQVYPMGNTINSIKGGLSVQMTVCERNDYELLGILDHDIKDDETLLVHPGAGGTVTSIDGQHFSGNSQDLRIAISEWGKEKFDLSQTERKEVILYEHHYISQNLNRRSLGPAFLELEPVIVKAESSKRNYTFGRCYPEATNGVVTLNHRLCRLDPGLGHSVTAIVWVTGTFDDTTRYYCIIAFYKILKSEDVYAAVTHKPVVVPVYMLYPELEAEGQTTLSSSHPRIDEFLAQSSVTARLQALSEGDTHSKRFKQSLNKPVRVGDIIFAARTGYRTFFGNSHLVLYLTITRKMSDLELSSMETPRLIDYGSRGHEEEVLSEGSSNGFSPGSLAGGEACEQASDGCSQDELSDYHE